MTNYWRKRGNEIPVVCYNCSNCGTTFQYFSFAQRRHRSGLNFCSDACKTEWYYFKHQMSQSQLNVLGCLLETGGRGKLLYSRSIDSLQHKIVPLITILHVLNEHEVFAEITDNGRRWYELKTGIRA